mgnify:CR=1 FL=1
MKETLELTSVPVDADCQQVGTKHYDSAKARKECAIFMRQLERQSPAPGNAYLRIKGNSHDFGTYYEVAAVFNPEDEAENDWAYNLENNLPLKWDEQAWAELRQETT